MGEHTVCHWRSIIRNEPSLNISQLIYRIASILNDRSILKNRLQCYRARYPPSPPPPPPPPEIIWTMPDSCIYIYRFCSQHGSGHHGRSAPPKHQRKMPKPAMWTGRGLLLRDGRIRQRKTSLERSSLSRMEEIRGPC